MATLYKEKQRYTDVPNIIALSLLTLALIYGSYIAYLQPEQAPASSLVFIVLAVITGGALWWLTRLKMKVTINDKHIKFKVAPIHAKKRKIAWDEVEHCEIVETSPIAQLQGGNITFDQEKLFSFTGRNGLSITTTSGKHYFIGSSNPDEMKQALAGFSR
jgi:hypothetical protein